MTNTHIWCEVCGEIRPFREDAMLGRDVTDRFENATDILCNECDFVIATTYTPVFVKKD